MLSGWRAVARHVDCELGNAQGFVKVSKEAPTNAVDHGADGALQFINDARSKHRGCTRSSDVNVQPLS